MLVPRLGAISIKYYSNSLSLSFSAFRVIVCGERARREVVSGTGVTLPDHMPTEDPNGTRMAPERVYPRRVQ